MSAYFHLFDAGEELFRIDDNGKLESGLPANKPFIDWRNNLYRKYLIRYNNPNCEKLINILTKAQF